MLQLCLGDNLLSGTIPAASMSAVAMSLHGLESFSAAVATASLNAVTSVPTSLPEATYVSSDLTEAFSAQSIISKTGETGFGNAVALINGTLFVGASLAGNICTCTCRGLVPILLMPCVFYRRRFQYGCRIPV
jgi:hypothetical protein